MVALVTNNVNFDYSSYYPSHWPATPFHQGELEVQKRLGVASQVHSYAPRVIRPYMPEQHVDFYQAQPFLVAAARDDRGMMWSTLLFSSSTNSNNDSLFVTSPNPTELKMKTRPLKGDALEKNAFQPGSDLGLLGIEFETRRRNRVNGRIILRTSKNEDQIDDDTDVVHFKVDQSFGNCPQYIKPRSWWVPTREKNRDKNDEDNDSLLECQDKETTTTTTTKAALRSDHLTPQQIEQIRAAETIFVATGYRGEGEDPRYGNDASHRGGGSMGFLYVHEIGKHLILPDYSGNNHYNTIGNLVMDPRMGITIPLFETGGMIQLSGNATIVWGDGEEEREVMSKFPGALRLINFEIKEVVTLPSGSLPLQWDAGTNLITLQVVAKEKESDDVTSFYLAPIGGESPVLPTYKPGQHLPVTLPVDDEREILRTYSISLFDANFGKYRISVKREPFGIGSRFLHDEIKEGDVINVQKPAGDFIYNPSTSSPMVIFISAGIGVTPLLSMLHAFVKQGVNPHQKAIWIYSARDGKHHPFQDEISKLEQETQGRLKTFTTYTKPTKSDDFSGYDFSGRLNGKLLKELLGTDEKEVDIFMCGPSSFIGDVNTHLKNIGVNMSRVQFETF